jgi:aminoacrylate hydrolase
MPQFQNGAASVHYEILGEGSPLLLIAGTASDGASWRPLLELLPGRQLILIDNRASGQTRVDGPVELAEMVADCAALLDHLELQQVEVVGHSLGGFLGLALAATRPTRVKRMVTMGAGTISPKSRTLFRDLSRLYFTVPAPDWFRLLYQWLFSTPFFADESNVAAAAAASVAYAYRQSPGDFARQVAAIDRGMIVDLSLVACEVLALSGDFDLLAPAGAVEELHGKVPRFTHAPIANAAHSLHWEAPAAVAREINAFLR